MPCSTSSDESAEICRGKPLDCAACLHGPTSLDACIPTIAIVLSAEPGIMTLIEKQWKNLPFLSIRARNAVSVCVCLCQPIQRRNSCFVHFIGFAHCTNATARFLVPGKHGESSAALCVVGYIRQENIYRSLELLWSATRRLRSVQQTTDHN